MNLTDLGIIALASGRVAFSVTNDSIFEPLRERIYERSAPDGLTRASDGVDWRFIHRGPKPLQHTSIVDFDAPPRTPAFFGQLFQCLYCFSFWTSLGFIAAYAVFGHIVALLLLPFAIWMVATKLALSIHS